MKIVKFFIFLFSFTASAVFADSLTLMNQTSYPSKKPKTTVAVQWAFSGQDVDIANTAMITDKPLDPKTLEAITQTGKISLTIPANAQYFRIVIWTQRSDNPDLVTNWVDVVSNKTYTLGPDHLVPAILMLGTGC